MKNRYTIPDKPEDLMSLRSAIHDLESKREEVSKVINELHQGYITLSDGCETLEDENNTLRTQRKQEDLPVMHLSLTHEVYTDIARVKHNIRAFDQNKSDLQRRHRASVAAKVSLVEENSHLFDMIKDLKKKLDAACSTVDDTKTHDLRPMLEAERKEEETLAEDHEDEKNVLTTEVIRALRAEIGCLRSEIDGLYQGIDEGNRSYSAVNDQCETLGAENDTLRVQSNQKDVLELLSRIHERYTEITRVRQDLTASKRKNADIQRRYKASEVAKMSLRDSHLSDTNEDLRKKLGAAWPTVANTRTHDLRPMLEAETKEKETLADHKDEKNVLSSEISDSIADKEVKRTRISELPQMSDPVADKEEMKAETAKSAGMSHCIIAGKEKIKKAETTELSGMAGPGDKKKSEKAEKCKLPEESNVENSKDVLRSDTIDPIADKEEMKDKVSRLPEMCDPVADKEGMKSEVCELSDAAREKLQDEKKRTWIQSSRQGGKYQFRRVMEWTNSRKRGKNQLRWVGKRTSRLQWVVKGTSSRYRGKDELQGVVRRTNSRKRGKNQLQWVVKRPRLDAESDYLTLNPEAERKEKERLAAQKDEKNASISSVSDPIAEKEDVKDEVSESSAEINTVCKNLKSSKDVMSSEMSNSNVDKEEMKDGISKLPEVSHLMAEKEEMRDDITQLPKMTDPLSPPEMAEKEEMKDDIIQLPEISELPEDSDAVINNSKSVLSSEMSDSIADKEEMTDETSEFLKTSYLTADKEQISRLPEKGSPIADKEDMEGEISELPVMSDPTADIEAKRSRISEFPDMSDPVAEKEEMKAETTESAGMSDCIAGKENIKKAETTELSAMTVPRLAVQAETDDLMLNPEAERKEKERLGAHNDEKNALSSVVIDPIAEKDDITQLPEMTDPVPEISELPKDTDAVIENSKDVLSSDMIDTRNDREQMNEEVGKLPEVTKAVSENLKDLTASPLKHSAITQMAQQKEDETMAKEEDEHHQSDNENQTAEPSTKSAKSCCSSQCCSTM